MVDEKVFWSSLPVGTILNRYKDGIISWSVQIINNKQYQVLFLRVNPKEVNVVHPTSVYSYHYKSEEVSGEYVITHPKPPKPIQWI